MYSQILLYTTKSGDRDILDKQISMLKERHKAELLTPVTFEEAEALLPEENGEEVLVITDDGNLSDLAAKAHCAVNDPEAMRQSYLKAMEMLRNFTKPGGK